MKIFENNHLTLGILFSLLSFLCLATVGVLAKFGSHYTTSAVLVFSQSAVSFILILPYALIKNPKSIKTRRLPMHIFRAVTGTGAWLALFVSITMTSLNKATLLTYSSPLWMPLLGHFFFKEKVAAKVWLGVLIGFIGIASVLHPRLSLSFIDKGMLYSLGAAILMALALFSVRWLKTTEKTETILFYYFLLSTVLFAPLAYFNWQTPNEMGWLCILGLGIALLLSQLFIVIAYHYASAVQLSPYIYTVILFTTIMNWLIWHEVPQTLEYFGMGLVIIGGVFAMLASRPSQTKVEIK